MVSFREPLAVVRLDESVARRLGVPPQSQSPCPCIVSAQASWSSIPLSLVMLLCRSGISFVMLLSPQCSLAHPCYGACVNLSPGYRCGACPAGYHGNAPSGVGLEHAQRYKQNCTEIDECAEGKDACDPNAKCINTLVSGKEAREMYSIGIRVGGSGRLNETPSLFKTKKMGGTSLYRK